MRLELGRIRITSSLLRHRHETRMPWFFIFHHIWDLTRIWADLTSSPGDGMTGAHTDPGYVSGQSLEEVQLPFHISSPTPPHIYLNISLTFHSYHWSVTQVKVSDSFLRTHELKCLAVTSQTGGCWRLVPLSLCLTLPHSPRMTRHAPLFTRHCAGPVTISNEVFTLSCLPRNLCPAMPRLSLNTMLRRERRPLLNQIREQQLVGACNKHLCRVQLPWYLEYISRSTPITLTNINIMQLKEWS